MAIIPTTSKPQMASCKDQSMDFHIVITVEAQVTKHNLRSLNQKTKIRETTQFSNFSCMFLNPNIFFSLNSSCVVL